MERMVSIELNWLQYFSLSLSYLSLRSLILLAMLLRVSYIVLFFSVALPLTPAALTISPGFEELVEAVSSTIAFIFTASPSLLSVKRVCTDSGSVSSAVRSAASSITSCPLLSPPLDHVAVSIPISYSA